LWNANYDGEDGFLYLELEGGYVRIGDDTSNTALERLADAVSFCLEHRQLKADKEAKKQARKTK